jgi:tetratricopeptide (TPR) repeat protein
MVSPPEESRPKPDPPISGAGYNHFVNASLLELNGVFEEALKEYENALRYFPNSAIIRTDYARLLFRLQRIPEALQEALQIEPKSAEVCLLIGDCYRLTDRIGIGVTYYKRAIGLDPDNINAYWYLAGHYRQKGEVDSAIASYYELARLSDTYRIWHELGTMLGKNRQYKEALEAFNRAIGLYPDKANINAYLGMAATYDALDSVFRAEEIFDLAIELAADEPRIYRQRLEMYLARQDIKKAIPVSLQLITLVPSDWVAQRRHGVLLYGDDRLDKADSLFRNRIEFGDENVLNYFYLGLIARNQLRRWVAEPWIRLSTAG